MGFQVRDLPSAKFTVTSFSEDLTIAGNESSAANIAAVLTTLINELNKLGIIEASVSA